MSDSPRKRSRQDLSSPAQDARTARLAEALRANLHKRKRQQRGRTDPVKTEQTDGAGVKPPAKAP